MNVGKKVLKLLNGQDRLPSVIRIEDDVYSVEWLFETGERLFLDITEDGFQIVFKNKKGFHQYMTETNGKLNKKRLCDEE